MTQTVTSAISRAQIGLSRRPLAVALWLGGMVLIVALAVALASAEPHPDVAWLVYLAEQVLKGKTLYVDLIEVNPPLIIVLSEAPTWIALRLGIPPVTGFMVATGLLILASAWSTAVLLRRYAPLFADRLPVAAIITIVLALVPRLAFGQREHLLVALVLPYLALLALRLRGSPVGSVPAVAIGVAAAIGFALKPYHLLSFLILEALMFSRGLRQLRPETIAVGAVSVAYVLAIAAFFPSYFTGILPLNFAYYKAEDAPLTSILLGRYFIAICAVALALAVVAKARGERDPLLRVLLAFALGGTIAYVIQQKGWFYQALPSFVALALALLYCMPKTRQALSSAAPRRRAARVVLLASFAIACLLQAVYVAKQADAAFHPEQRTDYRLAQLIRHDHARSLLMLTERLDSAWPLVNRTGVQWTSRFYSPWALAGEIHQASQSPQHAQRIRDWMVEDFVRTQPDLVLIDTRNTVDFLSALLSVPDFAEAWRSYRERDPVAGFRVFARGEGTDGQRS